MDPVTIGTAVGTMLVARVAGEVLRRAADPKKVAVGVNWLFTAVTHFLKVRRKEVSAESPIPRPPENVTAEAPFAGVTDEVVEQEAAAVERISKSPGEPAQDASPGDLRLAELGDFEVSQIEAEIESLLKQLATYLRNLRFEEEKAAQYGGPAMVPTIVMNTIRLQRVEIAQRLVRLNESVLRAYGHAAPGLDMLVAAAKGES